MLPFKAGIFSFPSLSADNVKRIVETLKSLLLIMGKGKSHVILQWEVVGKEHELGHQVWV